MGQEWCVLHTGEELIGLIHSLFTVELAWRSTLTAVETQINASYS